MAVTEQAMGEWLRANGCGTGLDTIVRWGSGDKRIGDAFSERGFDLGCDNPGWMALPIGRDYRPIRPGDVAYGEDGHPWKVIGVGTTHYPVIATDATHAGRGIKRLKAGWLTHESPARTPGDVARAMETLADAGMPADPDRLRGWARELREAK